MHNCWLNRHDGVIQPPSSHELRRLGNHLAKLQETVSGPSGLSGVRALARPINRTIPLAWTGLAVKLTVRS
jgi:hypothetical protein